MSRTLKGLRFSLDGEEQMAGGRVLVVGAGVGGMTLARTLKHLSMDVKVFDRLPERHSHFNRGLGLWDNSQICLRAIGMAPFLDGHARFVPPAAYRSVDGTWLSRCSNTPQNQRRVACVEQAQLLSVLEHGISDHDGVHVEWGKQVVTIEDATEQRGVVLHFADGTSEEGSLVIGADGVESVIRERLFPDHSLKHTNMACFSAVVDVAASEPPFETLGSVEPVGFPGRCRARFAAVPLMGERMFWFATLHVSRFAAAEVPEEQEAQVRWLAESFEGWHAPIPSLIAAAERAPALLREDIYELERELPSWSSAAHDVALLGDAAHPLSPNLAQGAAVAIEDAVDLGFALHAARSDPAPALALWHARRRPRVAACRRVTGFTKLLARFPDLAAYMALVRPTLSTWVAGAGRWWRVRGWGQLTEGGQVPAAINGRVFDMFLDHSLNAGTPFKPSR